MIGKRDKFWGGSKKGCYTNTNTKLQIAIQMSQYYDICIATLTILDSGAE